MNSRSSRRFSPILTYPRFVAMMAATALLSMGFAMQILRSDVSQPLTIGCYASTDLDAATAVVGADGRSPTAVCKAIWERGDLGPGTVPPLAECMLDTGAVGVFPGGQHICADLDLAPLDAASNPQGNDAVILKAALVDRFLASGCLERQTATNAVREEFRAQGLVGWKVVNATGFSTDRPCASLAFEPATKRVLLVPVPRVRSVQ